MKVTSSKKLGRFDTGNFEPKRLADLNDFKGAFREKVAKESKWPGLVEGDIIDVVAPASACSAKELRDGVRTLSDWGYTPRVPKGLLDPSPMFANTDAKRFEFLKKAIVAADSKAIWCVRGGYGAIRLLPELQKLPRPKTKKLIIGYSDITTLHSFVQNAWRWPSLHGPLLDRVGSGVHPKADLLRLQRLLKGEQTVVSFKGLIPVNQKAKGMKSEVATITGGNLCVLTSSLGSPWAYSAKNKFLFLEEIGEKPHRVDRFLVQLSQSGYLDGCKGILLGNFLEKNPSYQRMIWAKVITEFAASTKIPVFRGLPVGHGKIQRALPFGTAAKLKAATGGHRLMISTGVKI